MGKNNMLPLLLLGSAAAFMFATKSKASNIVTPVNDLKNDDGTEADQQELLMSDNVKNNVTPEQKKPVTDAQQNDEPLTESAAPIVTDVENTNTPDDIVTITPATKTATPVLKPVAKPVLKKVSKPFAKNTATKKPIFKAAQKIAPRTLVKSKVNPVQRAQAKPVLKPGNRIAPRTLVKPQTRQIFKPGLKPVAKSTPRPMAIPTFKPVAKQFVKPVSMPTTRVAPRPMVMPTFKPVAKQVVKPVSMPVTKVAPRPMAMPTYKPAAKQVVKPVYKAPVRNIKRAGVRGFDDCF